MRALLVEDDPSTRDILAEALSGRLHDVTTAPDDGTAWEICQREPPAFVVLPWRAGASPAAPLLDRIRSLPNGDQILVFAIVPADRPEQWEAALEAGANDYIPKPVDLRLVEWRLAVAERQSGELRRRRAAEDSVLKLEKVVGTMQIGVTVSDLEGKIVFINPAEATMHGYSVEELLGQSVRIFVANEAVSRRTPEALARIGRWSRERWSRKKDGTLLPVRLLSDLLTGPSGEPLGVVTTCEDITERRRAEEALRSSEHRYRSLVETANDVIGAAAADGTITSLNPAFETMTGFWASEWIGRPFAPLIHPDDLPRTMKVFARALAGQGTALVEARVLTRSGSYVLSEYTATPRVENGAVSGVLTILRDISERKRTERLKSMQFAVTRLLAEAASVEEAAPRLLALVSEALEWPVAEYWQVAPGNGALRFLHVPDGSDPRLDAYARAAREMPFLASVALPARVAGSGTPTWVCDVAADPDLPRAALAKAADLHAAVGFPVTTGPETAGVALFLGREVRDADPNLLSIIEDVGRQLGQFVRRTAAEVALRASEERFALAVLGANDGIWDWNLTTGEAFFSTRWKLMLGHEEAEVGARPEEWFERVHPDDRDRLLAQLAEHLKGATPLLVSEYRMRHRDGTYRWVLTRGAAVRDERGVPHRMAGSQTDVMDRRGYDPLTVLPNRALFLERLELAHGRGRTHPDYGYAVLFLDLDRFKEVNDTLGHLAGDQLLIAVARRLEECLRPGDTVARFGGDEFTILLDRIIGMSDAVAVAERIEARLRVPIVVGENELRVSASIGITLGSTSFAKTEDILREADTAMYRAKASGRARHEISSEPPEAQPARH